VAHFGDLQGEIYARGVAGQTPRLPMTYAGLEAEAAKVMTPRAFGYVAGGAGGESTARENVAAFERWRIDPRVLREVVERDLSTEILGTRLSAPVLTAPVGALSVIQPGGEVAVAEAAGARGVGLVVSTLTSAPMEEIAAAATGPRWFQLYWPRNRDLAVSLARRAEAAGFTALVVTVDTWTLAWRPRDLQEGFLPFLTGAGLANYLTDPVFTALLSEPADAGPEAAAAAVQTWAALFGQPALSWADLAWLTRQTSLPVLVKGVTHPADARAAVEAGVDGIVVSNHGGRQIDNAKAALDGLVDVVDAVGDRTAVLFDSGIRSGAHIVVALALGADAVLVGRPWVYGLALDGRAGVEHVLANLLAELDITLALAGYASPHDLDRQSVVRAP
jgi:L-lactate dehydrogenase (cytochrome)